jgi:hypothetical protein
MEIKSTSVFIHYLNSTSILLINLRLWLFPFLEKNICFIFPVKGIMEKWSLKRIIVYNSTILNIKMLLFKWIMVIWPLKCILIWKWTISVMFIIVNSIFWSLNLFWKVFRVSKNYMNHNSLLIKCLFTLQFRIVLQDNTLNVNKNITWE